ncbi:MAG: GntR family transcriptional regulator [Pseudomonadota bacterium]
MVEIIPLEPRKTTADYVFDFVFQKISSMEWLPGAKISEADLAKQLNVSRQPVRDAFTRLDSINLLLVRPQRPTEVRRFSKQAILSSRFQREAIEAEVLRRAAKLRTDQDLTRLGKNLEQQRATIKSGATAKFHDLDIKFHELLCVAAQVPFASDIIRETKSQIDRICLLSIEDGDHMQELWDDHAEILRLLETRNTEELLDVSKKHLSRLNDTLTSVEEKNPDYFEP